MESRPNPKDQKALNRVRGLARAGNLDNSIPELVRLVEAGVPGAAPSLAEIRAFQGDWSSALELASSDVRNPAGVYAGNVYADMVRLMAVSIRETGQWKAPLPSTAAEPPKAKLLANLARLQASQGAHQDWLAAFQPRETEAQYQDALKRDAANSRLSVEERKRNQLTNALWSGRFETAVELFGSVEPPVVREDEWILSLRAFASTSRQQDVPLLAIKHLNTWYPVDGSQVAPMALVLDPIVSPLLDQSVRTQVLFTPKAV